MTGRSLPNQLILSASEFSPSVLRSRDPFTARFRIMDTEGHFVSGAEVFLSAIPFGRVAPVRDAGFRRERLGDVHASPDREVPAGQGVSDHDLRPGDEARRDDLRAGVSARRLVSVNINPR